MGTTKTCLSRFSYALSMKSTSYCAYRYLIVFWKFLHLEKVKF